MLRGGVPGRAQLAVDHPFLEAIPDLGMAPGPLLPFGAKRREGMWNLDEGFRTYCFVTAGRAILLRLEVSLQQSWRR